MHAVTVIFEAKEEYQKKFLEAALNQAKNSLTLEEGCHRFDVCIDPENPAQFFLYELYVDKSAFDDHLMTNHYLDFNTIIARLDIELTTARVDPAERLAVCI